MKISVKTAARFTPIQGREWHNLTLLDKSIALTRLANEGYTATLAIGLATSDRDSSQALEFLAGRYVDAAYGILHEYDNFCQKTKGCEYAALANDSEHIVCVAMTLAENIIDYSHERLMSMCHLIALLPC